MGRNKYLLTVDVSARELSVWIPVNIRVFSTHIAITCPTNATLTHTQTHQMEYLYRVNYIMRNSNWFIHLMSKDDLIAHPTADAAISLHHTLSIGVTRAGFPVGAEPGCLAASPLVSCEASFTISTAEGALMRTILRQKPWPPAIREWYSNFFNGLTIVLWQCELAVHPPFCGGPRHSSISSHTCK